MKLAYLTQYDARNINRWSGTGYYLGESMREAGLDVAFLGPLREKASWYIALKWNLYHRVRRRAYMGEVDPVRVGSFGRQATRRVRAAGADVVLAPHTLPIAWLKTPLPIVLWADCTFGGMVDFYPYYQNLCGESLRAGHRAEQAALDRCRLAIFASDWAAQTAREIYHVPAERIRVVPYGANIQCRRTRLDVERLIVARPAGTCKLLFIGRIWPRKGGDHALAVARALNEAGLPTELTLVGSGPPDGAPLPPYVRCLGFVDKSKPENQHLLDQLLAESHFLIVPSRAEAFGIVFCEANSFGVPSLATRVGGIPSVVRDDCNGRTFPLDAPATLYRDYVLGLMRDYSRYQALAAASFQEYQTRLNWSAAARTVRDLLTALGPAAT